MNDLHVRTPWDLTLVVRDVCPSTTTTGGLAKHLATRTGIEPSMQALSWSGKPLPMHSPPQLGPNAVLADYGEVCICV